MKREVKTPGNTLESMCVAACTMVENKISKYIEGGSIDELILI